MKKSLLIFVLLFPSITYLFWSLASHNAKKLPIFGPREVVANKTGETDTAYHQLPAFSFTNQYGNNVTQNTIKNKILVVDYFFTTCKSICPIMSTQIARVQQNTMDFNDIVFLSHTVDPLYDTVEVMLDYAEKMGAINGRWHFLTGNKKELYDLARNGYFVTAMEGDGGTEDFIHSEKLVLLDKQQRIRGFYDGTDKEDVDRLIDEINVLKKEEFIPWKDKKNGNN